ncbi:MAG: hypothetical protein HRF49_00835 [bacterium]|jgi:hypothetical protein
MFLEGVNWAGVGLMMVSLAAMWMLFAAAARRAKAESAREQPHLRGVRERIEAIEARERMKHGRAIHADGRALSPDEISFLDRVSEWQTERLSRSKG